MKKVYAIMHQFTTDGGFGDVVYEEELIEEELIAVFEDKKMAEAFKEKFQKPHVYEIPYDELVCGELEIRELSISENLSEIDTGNFWWLTNKVIEVEE